MNVESEIQKQVKYEDKPEKVAFLAKKYSETVFADREQDFRKEEVIYFAHTTRNRAILRKDVGVCMGEPPGCGRECQSKPIQIKDREKEEDQISELTCLLSR